MHGRRQLIALGIDAAEPALVRRLVDDGEVPNIGALMRDGRSGAVVSPADVGSGAVWPTFATGLSPAEHGVYSLWAWNPSRMGVEPVLIDTVSPFWRSLAARGLSVGVVDVPFVPPAPELSAGAEILEWGSHDWIRRTTSAGPDAARRLLRSVGPHPFSERPLDAWANSDEPAALDRLTAACVAGAGLRGSLASRMLASMELDVLITVFSEVHRASHMLWHTVDPMHTRHRTASGRHASGVADTYRAIDRQVGRILGAARPDAAVLVFSLHGMRSSDGVQTSLGPLLEALGFAHVGGQPEVHPRAFAGPARRMLGEARHRTPRFARRAYRRFAPPAFALRRAGPPDPVAGYDWSRTRAFPLPTDQHGWVRINLEGREAAGVVPPEQFESVRGEVAAALEALRTTDGRRAIDGVVYPSRVPGAVPDIVVHWAPDFGTDPVAAPGKVVCGGLRGSTVTGQHADDGFFVLRGADALTESVGDRIEAQRLHELFVRALER